ncbi:MAG: hypothetical protein QG555_1165 [Thermodesulfobacteriota bacterium]|nr:hypothetical protein [Thermodesulfobacteriota bacterium]
MDRALASEAKGPGFESRIARQFQVVTMQIIKLFLLLAVIVTLFGCATWRDREGNTVPDSVKNICDNKCSFYENNQGAYTYKVCFNECMGSKGYLQY